MSRISLRRLNERADLSVPRGTPQMGARYDADAFGRFAEGMARFLGTGRFIVGQTVLVVGWIILNTVGAIKHWDPYPFILLNLAFSTQAAYAAPLILLAQNRQDDRDRANIERDRDVAARTQADTEFLARELAAVRLSLADVVTTHDLEDSLSQLAKLITDQPRPGGPDLITPPGGSRSAARPAAIYPDRGTVVRPRHPEADESLNRARNASVRTRNGPAARARRVFCSRPGAYPAASCRGRPARARFSRPRWRRRPAGPAGAASTR